ncbi:MAG: hypothetical protein HY901_32535 [Deltaproteobacteria bacterium]|nr:hypothetical protein [Deltaproteobacteria bacterium]
MATPLEDLAHAYLEGDLSHDEARAFERDLATRPELSQALARTIALRDLLQSMPPDAPPAGLEDRIAAALELQAFSAEPEALNATLAQVRAAFAGAGWAVRGPALAFEPATAAASQSLGRLVPPRAERGPKPPGKPLWRRALALQPAAAAATQALGRLIVIAEPRPKPLWQRALAFAWRRR